MTKKPEASKAKSAKQKPARGVRKGADFPIITLEKAIRIPKAILEQNGGQPSTSQQVAKYIGVKYGPGYRREASSANKYGLLDYSTKGFVKPSELALTIIRPKKTDDEKAGRQKAILEAPTIGDVYRHYRGENIPDDTFFKNALVDNFKIPVDRTDEFKDIFVKNILFAGMGKEIDGKLRLENIDAVISKVGGNAESQELKRIGKGVTIDSTDTCFVMMPFAPPIGDYYKKIIVPAIEKAKMKAVRADDDMFGTGKIIEQIWNGINQAKVLVAELTNRNANVFYELGLAHALNKPVVLVSSNETDVPFDLKHIRVIYYDKNDPFWGTKLIEKIAENIVSALANPKEAMFSEIVKKGS